MMVYHLRVGVTTSRYSGNTLESDGTSNLKEI
jgi:hypothetical protein